VGKAGHRRPRLFEKDLSRGVSRRSELVDDPAQARELPAAFRRFDFDRVARVTQRDVERLLKDEGIIRHRGKIESTINNASARASSRRVRVAIDYFWTWQPAPRRGRDASRARC
jgi:DNA-3-methyladenine glycosylase I